ncbi:MAG: class I SAM-dependent methyltransferase [Anaerolineaceae bacterium]|nr:class I SAM-dependent methyltransferase [Anaerolineaceae bacterium]MBN2677363.1 class I SAM-dependent methyltransferase [Anaerolineaceae bacterium]
MKKETPPVCDYTASDYQQTFWDQGGRNYEDAAEKIALRKLLPESGKLLLEIGAGAGRNTPRYTGYERVILVDYSMTQLEQARQHLGDDERYRYVAADVYRLPFVDGLCDGATMIRTLHHMADPSLAISQVRSALSPGAVFILEYANKRNLKAILRYWLKKQTWDPFSRDLVEFTRLNFNFHPQAIRSWLEGNHFTIQRQLSVSHFRVGFIKKTIPPKILAGLDGLLQASGAWIQLTPSVFLRAQATGSRGETQGRGFYKCLACDTAIPESEGDLHCPNCKQVWRNKGGIYDFRLKT